MENLRKKTGRPEKKERNDAMREDWRTGRYATITALSKAYGLSVSRAHRIVHRP